jgi:hypothetical protein
MMVIAIECFYNAISGLKVDAVSSSLQAAILISIPTLC